MYRVNYKTKIYNAVDAMSTSYQLGQRGGPADGGLAVATDGKISPSAKSKLLARSARALPWSPAGSPL